MELWLRKCRCIASLHQPRAHEHSPLEAVVTQSGRIDQQQVCAECYEWSTYPCRALHVTFRLGHSTAMLQQWRNQERSLWFKRKNLLLADRSMIQLQRSPRANQLV